MGRKDYPSFASDFHRLKCLVPAANQAGANVEFNRRSLIVGVFKLRSVLQPSDVMDADSLAHSRRCAVTHFQIHVPHAGFGRDFVAGLAVAVRDNVGDCGRRHRDDQNDY